MASSQFVDVPASSANVEVPFPSWYLPSDVTQLDALASSSLLPVAGSSGKNVPELSLDGLWDLNHALQPLLSLTATADPLAALRPNANDDSASALGLINLPSPYLFPGQECMLAQPRRASTSDVPHYPDTQFFDRTAATAALSRSQSVPWMSNDCLGAPYQASYPHTYEMWPRPGFCTPASTATSATLQSGASSATLQSSISPNELFNGFPQSLSGPSSAFSSVPSHSPFRPCSLSPVQSASSGNSQHLYGVNEQALGLCAPPSLWPPPLDIFASFNDGCNVHPTGATESGSVSQSSTSSGGFDNLPLPTQNAGFDLNIDDLLQCSVSLTDNIAPRLDDVMARPAKRRSSPNELETNWQAVSGGNATQAIDSIPTQPVGSTSKTHVENGTKVADVPAAFKGRRWSTIEEESIVEKRPAQEGPFFYQVKGEDGQWLLCEYVQFVGLQMVTRFKCVCHNAYYGRQENLTRHMNEGIRSHPCPYCKKGFGREDNMKQHCRKVHGITKNALNPMVAFDSGSREASPVAPPKKRRRTVRSPPGASFLDQSQPISTTVQTLNSRPPHVPSSLGQVDTTGDDLSNATIAAFPLLEDSIWTTEVQKWSQQIATKQSLCP